MTDTIDVTEDGKFWRSLKQLTRVVRRLSYIIVLGPLVYFAILSIALTIIGIFFIFIGISDFIDNANKFEHYANIYMLWLLLIIPLAASLNSYLIRNILRAKRGAIIFALCFWFISIVIFVGSFIYIFINRISSIKIIGFLLILMLTIYSLYVNPIPLLDRLWKWKSNALMPQHLWVNSIGFFHLLSQYIKKVSLYRLIISSVFYAAVMLSSLSVLISVIAIIIGIDKIIKHSDEAVAIIFIVPVFIIVLAIPLDGIQFLLKIARSFRTQQHGSVFKIDPRPPVLYLRSFKDDQRKIQGGISRFFQLLPYVGPASIDEMATLQFQPIGPVVAIGRPGEYLISPGAAKEYVDEKDWLPRVKELIGQAAVIVITVGITSGLQREYEALAAAEPRHVVLVFPPFLDDTEMRNRWDMVTNELVRRHELPPFDPKIRILLLRDGFPILAILADRGEPDFMEVALAHAAEALRCTIHPDKAVSPRFTA